MYFDTHAHYDDAHFDADRDDLLAAMPEQGVDLILDPGCDVESSRTAVALADKYAHVYAAVGLHPENCGGTGEAEYDAVRALCRHKKVVAIGEIGLDYHWEDNPPREFQKCVFRRQIALALELNQPVIVHDRDAHADCFEIVKDYPDLRGVFHCYSGSAEMAAELIRRGWYLGFDGPITYKNARRALEVLAVTPMDRILIETDAPYLPPVPHRGERNDSRLLEFVVAKIAEVKGLSPAEVAALTMENGKRLFGIQ